MRPFQCLECKAEFPTWNSICDNCGSSLIVAVSKRPARHRAHSTPRLVDISATDVERLDTGQNDLNECLGGGIVVGTSTYLAGSPGAGKSTLALQAACFVSVQHQAIYFSGEEDLSRLRLRADRLKLPLSQLRVARFVRTDLIYSLSRVERARMIVVDSAQTITRPDLPNRAGSPTQLSGCALALTDLAQKLKCAVLIIGHVNKEDDLAGPRTVEHYVDTLLHFSAREESPERTLYASKNRFGPSFIKYKLIMQANGGF